MTKYDDHRGYFAYEHENPPKPFNLEFDPNAAARYAKVSASMEFDNYYSNHTREECKVEWARRYEVLIENGE